jgi:hydroxymethylpyrimidine pyrophosphatase-like HAD family hydrolase
MNHWIATDLDGTLFSRAWSSADAVPATWRAESEPSGGRVPSSWMPASVHRVMATLQQVATIVPVTARDAESFARVDVPGIDLKGPAVIANGAIILNRNGEIDSAWESEMLGRLEPWRAWLGASVVALAAQCDGNARPRLVAGPGGVPAYLVAKAAPGWWGSEAGSGVRESFDWGGCQVSLMGDELQVLPPGVGKRAALTEVMHRFFGDCRPILCLGDMPADLDFMRLGDLLATPRHSPLEGAWAGT